MPGHTYPRAHLLRNAMSLIVIDLLWQKLPSLQAKQHKKPTEKKYKKRKAKRYFSLLNPLSTPLPEPFFQVSFYKRNIMYIESLKTVEYGKFRNQCDHFLIKLSRITYTEGTCDVP